MAELDLRVRLLGKALRATSITGRTDEQIVRAQRRPVGHNPVVDLLLGGLPPGLDVREDTAAGAAGRIPVRVYRPSGVGGVLPLVVLMHGGGWATGTLDVYDWLAGNVALGAGAVVVSLDYRLAPAHRWPAAAEDCHAALVDVSARAGRWEADGGRVAVVGDSAGGNLAAVTALMARVRSGPAIAFQGLIYPATDLSLGSASIEENAEDLAFRGPGGANVHVHRRVHGPAAVLCKHRLRCGNIFAPDIAGFFVILHLDPAVAGIPCLRNAAACRKAADDGGIQAAK